MRLIVIASDSARIPTSREVTWILRLVGTPQTSEIPPPEIFSAVDKAAAQVRLKFPQWLWEWASSHEALGLEVFSGLVSWWWYTPLSEKSPLRSQFIRELYWLTLLRILFEAHDVSAVEWHGDDPLFASVGAKVAAEHGVDFQAIITQRRTRPVR